jgi:hypothetical protein
MVSINDKGQIIGGYVDNNGGHGFLYDHGTFYSIDPPGSSQVSGGPTARAMNDKGEVVARFQTQCGKGTAPSLQRAAPPALVCERTRLSLNHTPD